MKLEQLERLAKHFSVHIRSGIGPMTVIDEDGTVDDILDKLEKIPYIPFPVAFHTVDILVLRTVNGKLQLLCGFKPNKTFAFVIGGFVEPGQTAEEAAGRELNEETGGTVKKQIYPEHYMGSFSINDERYAASCHKITTSLFYAKIENDIEVKGGDDIERVEWFDVGYLFDNYKEVIIPRHHKLIEELLYNYLDGVFAEA